jgi:hypothetical protein
MLVGTEGESTNVNTSTTGSFVSEKDLLMDADREREKLVESPQSQWEALTLDFSKTVWRNTRTGQLYTFPTATSFAEKKEYLENILANEKEFEVDSLVLLMILIL